MKTSPASFCLRLYWIVLAAFGMASIPLARAGSAANAPARDTFDYAEPKMFTGILYEAGSQRTNVLFTFQRTAVRTNSLVYVDRTFTRPDGFVAATENAVYDSNGLVSFQMKEFQAKVSGQILITPDRQKMYIGFGHGLEPPKAESQPFPPDTEVDDTIYPFMMAHWDELMRGQAAKFRFISLEWKKAFQFRLTKVGEIEQDGRTLERIKMEPTNVFVAKLVNPLYFLVEKAAPHHVIEYIGRTTPRIKKGKSWKYLDAETVFDWKTSQ